ncbi:THC0290_0291 family protein [Flavobacterium muglaense]|uniref:Glutamate dehydrogenase n=1 Tax=Flavobacterium muglaense TaxID=2764716 RepID=A0A923N006_9FLAO|nr:glutamate dehydrogenase [Flavobacterium muglaense]MBC5838971.1 glutamate dehydrogenase [Flavobacterium muglaense]MBC5845478.1 glutamate dehydrogenase [Flavobacterium muglaense]
MLKQITLSLILLFGFSNGVNAQFGFSHEVGIIAGPVAFQSDYGQRYDLTTNAGNTGIGVGLIHYINFSYKASCNCYTPDNYFNDHFKLRSELSYNKTELKHFGEWVSPDKTSVGADQLRAMRGSTAVTNIGVQLEYFPLSIRKFTAEIGSLGPFISLGGQFSYYNAKASSTLGPLGTPLTTFPKYLTPTDNRPYGFSTEGGTVWSVVSSVGTRYKLSPLRDLMLDVRFQYYFSNWVDGLNPNPAIYKENKANDWLVWVNVGYIYHLQ